MWQVANNQATFSGVTPCTLSGTLSLFFAPSGTKALMRQFVANAPKAHESLSTEALRMPVQGTCADSASTFALNMPAIAYTMALG